MLLRPSVLEPHHLNQIARVGERETSGRHLIITDGTDIALTSCFHFLKINNKKMVL